MTKTLQLLRGTTAQNNSFTGHVGELTVDTTTNELRLHDGSTAGGHIIPNKAETQGLLGGGTAGTVLTNSGTPGTVNATSIDATPTDGSSNLVSSDGVYDALALKADVATTLAGYGITDGADTSLSNLTPTGEEKVFTPGFVMPFAGTSIPTGYLLCDGSAISRTTYADLFAVIGTTYGAGDGSTTFNVPDLNYTVPMWRNDAAAIGSHWAGSVPNITGNVNFLKSASNSSAYRDGVFAGSYTTSGAIYAGGTSNYSSFILNFNAGYSNGVFDSNNTGQVYPANRKMYYIIKY